LGESYGPSPTNFQGNEDMGDLEPKKRGGEWVRQTMDNVGEFWLARKLIDGKEEVQPTFVLTLPDIRRHILAHANISCFFFEGQRPNHPT